MEPQRLFRHCPGCGTPEPTSEPANPFHCDQCGFHYYFNPTVAAAALLLRADGQALFIRRDREPAQGRLALAGGFIDVGETAEAALRREVREEVGLEVNNLTYLCSATNAYHYRGITYPVLDLIFVGQVAEPEQAVPLDGVAGLAWRDPLRLDPAELAFPSMQAALALYQEGHREAPKDALK